MFKRRNSSRADRYRGGSSGGRGLPDKRKSKVSNGASGSAQRGASHVGKRKGRSLWEKIKDLVPQRVKRKSNRSHSLSSSGLPRPRMFRKNAMKNYKARGTATLGRHKNPFRGAGVAKSTHSGKRRNPLKKNMVTGISHQSHQGKKRSITKASPLGVAHQPYRATGKKYQIKSAVPKLGGDTPYRSSGKGRKYKANKRLQAEVSRYRSGMAGKKYKAKIKTVATTTYRSGATGKKYKVKAKGKVQSGYRSGATAKRHQSKLQPIQLPTYRSGQKGKQYRVKSKVTKEPNYRSGSRKKYQMKAFVAREQVPSYRSGTTGKKYRVKSKPLPKSNYSGSGKKAMKEVKVVAGTPYRSGTSSANRKKKLIASYQNAPYRKGGAVAKYKVKSTSKVRQTPRKFNATAARTKNLAYLQKNTKGKKRKVSEGGEYQGHGTFNQFLRGIILILFILVAISIGYLAFTVDEWLPTAYGFEVESQFFEKSNKNIF